MEGCLTSMSFRRVFQSGLALAAFLIWSSMFFLASDMCFLGAIPGMGGGGGAPGGGGGTGMPGWGGGGGGGGAVRLLCGE